MLAHGIKNFCNEKHEGFEKNNLSEDISANSLKKETSDSFQSDQTKFQFQGSFKMDHKNMDQMSEMESEEFKDSSIDLNN